MPKHGHLTLSRDLNIYFERRWVEEEDLKKKPTSLQPKT
jgi:hypothetical protein